MAYTVEQEKTVVGNLRMHICDVTADGASGNWNTGLNPIVGYAISPISMNSGAPLIKAATSVVTVSAATTGDHFYLFVYGR
jgi:hypothetical protein